MKPMRAKCAKCGDIVEVSHFKEYKSCKCGAISLDYGDGYYSRMGGAPEDFDKEFDKEQGVERFKGLRFKGFEQTLRCNDPNTDIYIAKDVDVELENMGTLVSLVWEWFELKGLKDPVMQMVKVQEEVGELAHQIARNKLHDPATEDALGDILVTIIGMCHHLHYHPAHALGVAYNEIKNRKGKVVEGNFVKDE